MQTYMSSPVSQHGNESSTHDLNALAEQIWRDLGEQTPRVRVHQVVAEVAAKFDQPRVTTFIPVLIRRYTLEQLRIEAALEER